MWGGELGGVWRCSRRVVSLIQSLLCLGAVDSGRDEQTYNCEARLPILLDVHRERHVLPPIDVLEQQMRLIRQDPSLFCVYDRKSQFERSRFD